MGSQYNKVLQTACWLWITLGAVLAADKDHRQADAHEHGHGVVNIAIEGDRLSIELTAPGADIVGFEHVARSDQQKAIVTAAKHLLSQPLKVVGLPRMARCSAIAKDIEFHTAANRDAKTEASPEHSEFRATYQFLCKSVAKLTHIEFHYFKLFTNTQELDVTVLSDKGQKKFEVTPKSAVIVLTGVI